MDGAISAVPGQQQIELGGRSKVSLASLGSGSRGNATLVQIGDQTLLVDCGFTLKELRVRLARLACEVRQLDAILVTHEHSDHARGVAILARNCGAPVYLSYGTARQLTDWKGVDVRPFDSHQPFQIGSVVVTPVSVPHDAREPTQFVFDSGAGPDRRRVGVLTDLGHVTPHVIDCYRGCHGLLMESNHDLEMLWRGRYPPALKRRIAGDLGHLANNQALGFLEAIRHEHLQHVLIGHVSEENNHPSLLERLYAPIEATVGCLRFATQRTGSDWVHVN